MSLLGKIPQVQEDTPEIDNDFNLKIKWFILGSLFVNTLHLLINIIIK